MVNPPGHLGPIDISMAYHGPTDIAMGHHGPTDAATTQNIALVTVLQSLEV